LDHQCTRLDQRLDQGWIKVGSLSAKKEKNAMNDAERQAEAIRKLDDAILESEAIYGKGRQTRIAMHPATRQEMAAFLPMGYMEYREDGERILWMKVVIDNEIPDGKINVY
jgi:hypothetical protein